MDRVTTPDGVDLVLWRRGERFEIRLNGLQLMSSEAHGSEEELAAVASRAVASTVAPSVLIGGLGMGFTLRAVLDRCAGDSEVLVAEVFPEVVGWNRGVLADLAERPLEDARVRVFEGDVWDALEWFPAEGGEKHRYDVILLDIDNGPSPFTLSTNDRVYGDSGVRRVAAALKPGGVLGLWSESPDPEFEKRLESVGFRVVHRQVSADGNQAARSVLHSLYLAKLTE